MPILLMEAFLFLPCGVPQPAPFNHEPLKEYLARKKTPNPL
jgi:hypothetical protein